MIKPPSTSQQTRELEAYFSDPGHPHRLLHLEPDPNEMVAILDVFTATHRQYDSTDIVRREWACFRTQLRGMLRPVQDEDLFVGRMQQMPIGITPQSKGSGMGYCIHPHIDQLLLLDPALTTANRRKLSELLTYWEVNGTVQKSRRLMPASVTDAIKSEYYYLESGIAFMLYRMSGVQLDYGKLIRLGIHGLKSEVERHLEESAPGSDQTVLYEGMLGALDLFSEVCQIYAAHLRGLSEQTPSDVRQAELLVMARVLDHIAHDPPQTLRQALQLMYLYNRLDGAKNYGRMDDYLAEVYKNDCIHHDLNDEEATRLLSSIWRLMISRDNRYDTRLVIGGKGRIEEAYADRVAMLIMETTRQVKDIVPQVALRCYDGQDPALYQKALDVLAEGNTYPMLYNDEVNLPAAVKAFDISKDESKHLIQYGCGEYVLNHRSVGTPSGVINLLEALLVTLNRGIDPITQRPCGMPLSRYAKYGRFEDFETLFAAYKEQVEYHVSALAEQEVLEYRHAAADNPYLYTSLLMDDCIARGKAVYDGGVRHLGGTLETYGNINVADSLVAIREWVYEKKAFTLEGLLEMLKADFTGYTRERNQLRSSPKYGNDDKIADQMVSIVHDHVCAFTRDQARRVGLDSYLVVVINNDANTVMGQFTSASPDGRKAAEPLNPGNNPSGGADQKGVTALLNSLVKPDPTIHAGAVQNMKFSKSLLNDHRPMFEALLATYFKNGGTQAMLTVVNKGDLEDAMAHPEKYPNLMVRVGGFSERFINLPRATQLEVLSRTLN